jgi:virulence-associated protein VagC
MRTQVTEQGIFIPKQMLEGVKEVEIRKEKSVIVIIPISEEDPILQFGKEPIEDVVTDASVNHDKYIY